ncbi:hypothetical protein FOCG_01075 [Fusarium oxysporum f. sp. radicis-lycopersici 26381]|uniref:Uncharacterized protein n=4 Tax=Fusarium oxysporum TaxID=5507 RepID=A0A0J9UEP8_FUSO4|nr:hypothetical protein FOXG_01707 [Fusarium oxysporum f. sp. lycopersici 4287]EXL62400.1 hypothetical protein FOCG_01075 [Fusarium oxysporum f. sp. radicis-lycopersici 26381]RKK21906.1 hypothetical protein BFJ65_g4532 [Fusarium oxysporum f. sp. cepae]RKK90725.1 hypothetical protein BFJ71_g11353 [Fusarium oxysporum]RYC95462.1 hypothetical protein BFJ63_vAg1747 [Fusarium oxysporum f. sp. narcissi]KNA96575.1 hypothetical protein FOXG_01707 [Fusarium oxysporum f. sp. lycopersici 4287]
MDEQRWKGNVNDNENTNSWPNETRSRHRNWSAAALGPGPTNLHQPLELSARSSADSTVAALASSFGNGDFKPSEGGFGGIQNCGSTSVDKAPPRRQHRPARSAPSFAVPTAACRCLQGPPAHA